MSYSDAVVFAFWMYGTIGILWKAFFLLLILGAFTWSMRQI